MRAPHLGWVLLALFAAGCAGPGADLHLAPLASRIARAGGGSESEYAAGAVRLRRAAGGRLSEWALRPLVSQAREENGDYRTRFLVPLGTVANEEGDFLVQLLPVFRYHSAPQPSGRRQRDFLMLPGILWRQDDSGRVVRAFFPFGGVIEDFLTFDRIDFVLFPLYMRTVRGERETFHFLFPVFAWSRSPGLPPSWRVWPLYGQTLRKGSDRRFWLWPIFHRHRDGLNRPPAEQSTKWMVFPLIGRTRRGSFEAWTFLWPFFGWSRDTESGFWAWDGPWPLVRIQRPGTSETARRTRFWPYWSEYSGDGLESTWALWPLINVRVETYRDGVRRAEFFFPWWQQWRKVTHEGAAIGRWTKLWPLFQEHASAQTGARTAVPALNPLWHTPEIDDHYAWLYELYTKEDRGEVQRERSWGGIYKRERDEREDRSYLSLLWARRSYVEGGSLAAEGAAPVHETSLLLGLLRWRSRGGASELLRPAFPGPGWPALREARASP